MEMDDRIRNLAKWYYDRLHTDKRTNGDDFYKFTGKGDEAQQRVEEERCRKLALHAHSDGGMLPDDWRYAFMNEALGAIMEAFDFDEIEVEPDIYNHELTSWLGSHGHRPGYCDDAVSEGLCSDDADMIQRITMGQYMEKREVLGEVLSYLREEAEEEESAEAETEENEARE